MALLALHSVSKRFQHRAAFANLLGRERSGSTLALENVSIEADRGEVIAVLGPNGSGKTTLFKITAGMLLPDTGTIYFDGRLMAETAHRHISMAVASERSFFPRLTAYENLDYFAALENIDRSDRALRVEKLLSVVSLTSQSDLLVQKFSSGMYQRLAIARALLRQPEVLLLDEPTRSLDPDAAESLWQWIRGSASTKSTTILIATHNFLEAAAVAQRAVILDRGRIIGGGPVDSSNALREQYFERTGMSQHSLASGKGV